jgi:hypothetical protein
MRIGKEYVFETEDWFFTWVFEHIGIIDFCEVTKECVLERNAYWKVNRLVFNWSICEHWQRGFERIGIIDFCEVTKEGVLESESIGFIIGNLSTLAE